MAFAMVESKKEQNFSESLPNFSFTHQCLFSWNQIFPFAMFSILLNENTVCRVDCTWDVPSLHLLSLWVCFRSCLRNTTELSKSLLFREKQLNSFLIEWILSFLTGERKLVFTFKYYNLPLINIRWSLVWLPLHQTTPRSNLGLQWRNLDICRGWIDGLLMQS